MNSFDARAKDWDTSKKIHRAKMVSEEIESIFRENSYENALEYGCGTGLVGLNLQHFFKSITLMDSSVGMIDELNQKIKNLDALNVKAVHHDLLLAEYPEKFDCIFSSMVMHHVSDVAQVLSSFYKMLQPEGLICVVDLDKDDGRFHEEETTFNGYDGFEHEEMNKLLCEAGFEDIQIHTFYHDEKDVVGHAIPYSLFCASGIKRTK